MSTKYKLDHPVASHYEWLVLPSDNLPSDAVFLDGQGVSHAPVAFVEPTSINTTESIKLTKGGQTIRVNATDLPTFLAAGWTVVQP